MAQCAANPDAQLPRVPFQELWVGDRFKRPGYTHEVWTKLGHDTARRHSEESIQLRFRGYGYIGDTICSFEPSDQVLYQPATA